MSTGPLPPTRAELHAHAWATNVRAGCVTRPMRRFAPWEALEGRVSPEMAKGAAERLEASQKREAEWAAARAAGESGPTEQQLADHKRLQSRDLRWLMRFNAWRNWDQHCVRAVVLEARAWFRAQLANTAKPEPTGSGRDEQGSGDIERRVGDGGAVPHLPAEPLAPILAPLGANAHVLIPRGR